MTIKKIISTSILACTLLTTAHSIAQESDAPVEAESSVEMEASKQVGQGPNPFSDCGIGAALFPGTAWAAVVSNVIWDVGITGITSATASPETCQSRKVETAQFIIDNYQNLVEETAQGQGDHLSALMNVLDCNAHSQQGIVTAIRSDMGVAVSEASYPTQDRVGKASDYYDIVYSVVDGDFSESCSS